jgi:hypothetical protein
MKNPYFVALLLRKTFLKGKIEENFLKVIWHFFCPFSGIFGSCLALFTFVYIFGFFGLFGTFDQKISLFRVFKNNNNWET